MNISKYIKIIFIISMFISVTFFLCSEKKDGDWNWYVDYSDSIPDDHPLLYILMNGINLIVNNGYNTVLVTEIIVSCMLVFFVFLVSTELINNWLISGVFSILSFIVPFVNWGTPLKSMFGMALFFMFFYVLIKKRTDKEYIWKTGRIHYFRLLILLMIYILILFTHVVASYLVLLLITLYAFRGFKFSRNYLIESAFGVRILIVSILYVFFYKLSQLNFIYNSNSKIGFLSGFNFEILTINIININFSWLIIYEIILIVYIILMVKDRKYNYVDIFLILICSFLLFGAVPYTRWTFGRFMALLPFFSFLQLGKIFKEIW